jgi:uncharacterized protein YggE
MRSMFLTAFLLISVAGPVQGGEISVNGEAMVRVEPDEILVTFGIETRDKDILVAKRMNNDILQKALAAIQECGVSEQDIQTDHLSIQEGYDGAHVPKNFIGYFVRNTLVVTLDEASEVEELVTQALVAGVNYLHGIEFRTTELRKYRDQARELALQAALEKAERMAAVLGQSVGSPVQISEGWSPSMYPSSWSGWGYGRGRGMSQNVIQNAEGGSGEITDTIALGKISIQASVRVTFELEASRRGGGE